jgi:hypothetical protein
MRRFNLTNRINQYLQEATSGPPPTFKKRRPLASNDSDDSTLDDDWDDDDEDEEWDTDEWEGDEDEEYGEDADDWKDGSVGVIPNKRLRYFQRQLDRAYNDGLMDGYQDARLHLSSLHTSNLVIVAGLFLLIGALLPIICKTLAQ